MNRPLTPEEVAAVRAIIDAVAEAIQTVGSIPSGHLYAMLMGSAIPLTLSQYESVISLLVDQKKVRRDASHLLTWIGGSK